MERTIRFRRFYCLALLLLFYSTSKAQYVNQWRGPERRGVYHEAHLQNFWPPEGPVLAWANEEIGNGYGSPSFYENKILICGEIDSTAYLFALDEAGKILWKTAFGREWTKSYQGSRMTPTIHEGMIYVSSGMGNLACVELKTGKLSWMVNQNDLHGVFPRYGYSESPLIEGDMVFFMPGGKDTNVVALNRLTGKIIWICKGRGERPGYNSPLLVRYGDRSILVVFSAYSLLGIDAKTGKLLWVHEQVNTPLADRKPGNGDTHSNTVWYEDGVIYYIAGDGNGAVKLALEDKGSSVRQVWRNPTVDNYMGGFIISGEKIYTCSDSRKSLLCLDSKTGNIIDSLKCGTGVVISDGKMLYYYNQKGDIQLINPDKGKMNIVSYFRIQKGSKEHFSHPVIERGKLYVRHGKALMDFNIAKAE